MTDSDPVYLDHNATTPLLPAVVDARVYQGALIRYQLAAVGQSLVAEVQNQALRPQYDAGAQVTISWRPESTEVLPAD